MINMFSNNLDLREASKFCSHENRAINNNKKEKKSETSESQQF